MRKCNKDNSMKDKKKGKRIVKHIIFGIIALAALSLATMLLWNWLMPSIFGLTLISFWQAAGLLALSRILFGKFGRKGHNKRHAHKGNEHYHKELFKERFFASKHQVEKTEE